MYGHGSLRIICINESVFIQHFPRNDFRAGILPSSADEAGAKPGNQNGGLFDAGVLTNF